MAAHGGDGVTEGGHGLRVPGGAADLEELALVEAVGEQGDDREGTEQAGGGTRDGEVGPLPLGFDTEMAPGLLEGDLHAPAPDVEPDDLAGIHLWIGGEVGAGL